ncbi:syntabulin isoform X2 [Trematomus bernacchii]|uniref:syntabulin isoform X2 n=1 Tax=Trematomus bernacchii TaxID=40690 RepID=UPI00146A1A1A|nr:syntabulin isoform X2 [Trematomus bernacchii]
MGPFQEYEEKKSPEKGSPRSRIPRLVLHPFPPKDKGSPLSDSPLSEEEGKEGYVSSDHSKRTISTTSFCSDDTGCPTSQSVSPSKTPSGSEQSAHGSPVLPERKTKVKRVRVMAEWSGEPRSGHRHKRELRSAMKARGSEADFSSSSSTGSLKNREGLASHSAGKRAPTRSRGSYIRPLPVFKPAGSPTANRDSELYAPYRTPPRAVSSTTTTTANSSSCNSSPTSRRAILGRYHSCGDNHGIKPPNPEQYLTPLQQKELAIRHLKTRLLESETRVRDRETEVQELNAQLGRMREDWIEEECHRVEAQLSLKEARKEIKQLRQVVETMKSSLMEKDKGIQKYFIDINIQNRKLESLLLSMEMAQSGTNLQDENSLDFCDFPDNDEKKMVGEEEGGMEMGTQGAEAMADSGLLVNDEMANRADILEQIFMSTAVDFSHDSSGKLGAGAESGPGVSALTEDGQFIDESTEPALPNTVSTTVDIPSSTTSLHNTEDKETQTDLSPTSPDVQTLLLQLLHFHGLTVGETALTASSNLMALPYLPTPTPTTPEITKLTPAPPSMPTPTPPESPDPTTDSGMCCSEPKASSRFMEELDFSVCEEEPSLSSGLDVVGKRYWSNSFLVDLVAVAAPVLPTVAWLYSRHGVDGSAPVYNIAAFIRGCCIMGLHSLRHVPHRPDA